MQMVVVVVAVAMAVASVFRVAVRVVVCWRQWYRLFRWCWK